jgi:hypothetical protein
MTSGPTSRRRRTARLTLLLALLGLLGAATFTAPVRHVGSTFLAATSQVKLLLVGSGGAMPRYGPPGDRPSPSPSAPTDETRPHSASPTDGRDDYWRSLLFSGLFGLLIATIGLTMVSYRRRLW